MAISFKQSTTGSGTASPLSTTNFAGTVVAGNLIVVTVVDDSGISEPSMTVTDTGGNTYTRIADTGAANTGTTTMWYAPVTTGGATFHIIVTNPGGAFARLTCVAQEFQGFTGTPTFDKVSAYATGSSTAALSATSGTLSNAAELVVGGFGHYATASAFTLGTGYTNLGTVSVANASIAQESKVVAATTAVTAGATIAASREWNAFVATFFDSTGPVTRTINVTDSTAVTATPILSKTSYINVTDSTAVTDLPFYYDDTVIVWESVNIFIQTGPANLTFSVEDDTAVSDTPIMFIPYYTIDQSDFVETTAVTDSVIMRLFSNINVTDSTVVSDTPTIKINTSIAVSDSTVVSDSVIIEIIDQGIVVSDSTVVSDTPILRLFSNINVSDSTVVTDTPTIEIVSQGIIVSDSTVVSDTAIIEIVSFIVVSDSTIVSDTPVIKVNTSLNVTDSTVVSDIPTLELTSYINVSDSTVVTDTPVMENFGFVSITDSTAVTDTVVLEIISFINITDTSVVTDTPSVQTIAGVATFNVTDSTVVTDTPIILIPTVYLSVSDSTAVTDTVAVAIQVDINVTDSTIVSDTLTMSGTLYVVEVGGSPFNPASIAGLQVWLDANQIGLADNAPVTSWTDESGNGANATPGAYNSPTLRLNQINGFPAVQFVAASNQALRAFYTQVGGPNAAFTTFVVGRLNGPTHARLFGSVYPDNSNWLAGWWNALQDVAYFNGGFAGPQNPATTDWKQYTAKGDGVSTGYLYSSGVLLSPNSTLFGNPNGALALSGYDSSGTGNELSDGQIAEILVYNGALSDADRMTVEAYLNTKYFGTPQMGGETTAVSDTPILEIVSSINVTDTTVVSDNPHISIANYPLSVTDSTAVSDTVNLKIISFVSASDTTIVTDTPTIRMLSYINITDSTIVSDTPIIEIIDQGIVVTDSTVVSDTPIIRILSSINVTDTTAVSDTPIIHLQSYINVTDTTPVTDTPIILLPTLYINVTDTSVVQDSVFAFVGAGVFVLDTTNIIETVVIFIPILTLQITDTTAVTDTPILDLRSYIAVSDTTVVSDTPVVEIRSFVAVTDTTPVTDNVAMTLTSVLNVTDTTIVSDTPIIHIQSYISVTDTTAVSDHPILEVIEEGVVVTDTTIVSDTVRVVLISNINVTDTTHVTDTPILQESKIPLLVNVTDSTKVHDLPTLYIYFPINGAQNTIQLGWKFGGYKVKAGAIIKIQLGWKMGGYAIQSENNQTTPLQQSAANKNTPLVL